MIDDELSALQAMRFYSRIDCTLKSGAAAILCILEEGELNAHVIPKEALDKIIGYLDLD